MSRSAAGHIQAQHVIPWIQGLLAVPAVLILVSSMLNLHPQIQLPPLTLATGLALSAISGAVALFMWPMPRRAHEPSASVADPHVRACIALDDQGQITVANSAFCSLTGHTLAQARGRTVASYLSAEAWNSAESQRLVSAIVYGIPHKAVIPARTASCAAQWLVADWTPSEGGGGTLTLEDATDLVKFKEDLSFALGLLKTASLAGDLVFWECEGPNSPIMVSGEHALRDEVRRCPKEILSGPYGRVLESHLEAAWATGDKFEIEGAAVLVSGKTAWLRVTGQAEVQNGVVSRLSGVIRDCTRRRQLAESLDEATSRDSLTGLMTRQAFLQAYSMEQTDPAASIHPFALIAVDLDGLGAVNRTRGQTAGDQLLQDASLHIQEALFKAQSDGLFSMPPLLCRSGSDEFMAALFGLRRGEGEAVADALRRALDQAALPSTWPLRASVAAVQRLRPPASLDGVIAEVDCALAEAKRLGGGSISGFAAAARSFDGASAARLLHDLEGAADKGQFALAFRPVCSLESGAMTALESELRWNHPDAGSMSFKTILDLAREGGLLEPVAQWILDESCRCMEDWEERWPGSRSQRLFFHAEPRLLRRDWLTHLLYRKIVEHPSLSGRLVAVFRPDRSFDAAQCHTLEVARNAGVKVYLDASHDLPRSTPLDRIPLDGVIAGRKTVEEAVRSLDLGRRDIIASSVECAQDALYFRRLGCLKGKGSHFGRALSPEDAARKMAALALEGDSPRPDWVA